MKIGLALEELHRSENELAQRLRSADNLRQMRWANAKLKESATQVLLS